MYLIGLETLEYHDKSGQFHPPDQKMLYEGTLI
jgi:hypothetical protein